MHGFLAEIAASPDDDLPRLVYADWLEERGDPRGEFIRVQCELARHPDDPHLCARETELLASHRKEWLREIREAKPTYVEFRRGFIHSLAFFGDRFARCASQIFAAAPLIQALTLQRCRKECPELELIPKQTFIRDLKLIRSQVGPVGARRLSQCVGLRLTSLTVDSGSLGLQAIGLLSRAAHFKEVESLDFSRNGIGDEDLEVLADVWQPTRLRTLNLSQNYVSDRGLGTLVSTPALSRLRELDLYDNRVRLQIPWESPTPLLNLQSLDLSHNQLDITGPRMLGESVTFSRLKTLKLRRSQLTADDIAAILPFRVLTELDLSENNLGDGVVALVNCANVRLLRKLSLRDTYLNDIAAQALVSSPFLADIQELNLTDNHFSPPSLRALRERFGPRLIVEKESSLM